MTKTILHLAALTILLMVSQVNADDPKVKDFSKAAVPKDFKSHSDKATGITLSHPADWTAKSEDGAVMLMASDKASSLNIQAVAVGPAQLKDVLEESRKQLKSQMKDLKFLSDSPAKLGDAEANYWVFTTNFDGVPVKMGQLLAKKGDKIYIFTLGCEPPKWDKHSPVCEQIIASSKLGK